MAWNGSNGIFAGKPGYVSFTAWRNTPLEDAARDFMLARAGLPLGSLLWTFGTPRHADGDGWSAEVGTIALGRGALMVSTDAAGRASLVSPSGLALAPERVGRIVAGLPRDARLAALNVYARGAGASDWEPIALSSGGVVTTTGAGRVVTRGDVKRAAAIDQIKIELTFSGEVRAVPVTRIAVLASAF